MGTGINLTAFAAEAARLRRRSIIMRIHSKVTNVVTKLVTNLAVGYQPPGWLPTWLPTGLVASRSRGVRSEHEHQLQNMRY